MTSKPGPKGQRCPACDGQLVAQGSSGFFACRKCGGIVDSDPDEGGDYSDRDPSARLQRQERRKPRR